jgi:hypothetical protein
MKSSLLLSIGLFSVLTAQAQEAAPDVSTSRSVRQKINTHNLYATEVVEAPKITFQMGDGETYTATADQVTVKACIKTSKPLTKPVQVFVNGALQQANRELKVEADAKKADCEEPVSQTVQLREGENKVRLVAQNAGGIVDETFVINYTKTAPVVAEKRLALVIGNSDYPSTSRLMNPVNDATDMAKTLEGLGFDVIKRFDLNKKDMRKAIDEFGAKLKGNNYQVGLFFYAGHGIALAGQNFLVPIDASPQTMGDIEFDCEPANLVMAKMEDARVATNIVILDACRNNPFERSFNRGGKDGGLVGMESTTGSIIAYATSPGKTAADGSGRNGIYTAALLKNLNTPGLPIEEVFKRVRKEVKIQSGDRQQPWESSSLTDDFYFKRK